MHIAVAGNDIAGLTLALRLRIKGHDVAVHPSAPSAPLDERFTAIAPYRDLFLKSGVGLDDLIGLLPVQEPLRFAIDGRDIELPPAGSQRAAVAAVFGDAAAEHWAALLEHAADVWSQVRSGKYLPSTSLRRVARRRLPDRRLQTLLLGWNDATAADVSDAAVVFPYLTQTFGLWTFDGGLPRFESVLRMRCEERGVHFETTAAPADALAVRDHFSSMFAAPARPFRRSAPVATETLGLPFIGMAAEAIAERIGRA